MASYVIDNQAAEIPFEGKQTGAERIVRNCKNLIMCLVGEVPFDRWRGFDVRFLEINLVDLNRQIVKELDRVMLWEPRAEVVEAYAQPDGMGGVLVKCVVEVAEE